MKSIVFLPVKERSERVEKKNLRHFGQGLSLFQWKLRSLLASNIFDAIYVSTSGAISPFQDQLNEVVDQMDNTISAEVVVEGRPRPLQIDDSTSRLAKFCGQICADYDQIIWTHCTSPFLKCATIEKALNRVISKEYDSGLTVKRHQTFFLHNQAPVNFGNDENFWPRSQDLEPLFEVTSGFFLGGPDIFESGCRIGDRPLLIELNGAEAVDIDTLDDFSHAQSLVEGW